MKNNTYIWQVAWLDEKQLKVDLTWKLQSQGRSCHLSCLLKLRQERRQNQSQSPFYITFSLCVGSSFSSSLIFRNDETQEKGWPDDTCLTFTDQYIQMTSLMISYGLDTTSLQIGFRFYTYHTTLYFYRISSYSLVFAVQQLEMALMRSTYSHSQWWKPVVVNTTNKIQSQPESLS